MVGDLDEAAAMVNRIAPEHLELATAMPEALAAKICHAGAIFLGRYTPEAMVITWPAQTMYCQRHEVHDSCPALVSWIS